MIADLFHVYCNVAVFFFRTRRNVLTVIFNFLLLYAGIFFILSFFILFSLAKCLYLFCEFFAVFVLVSYGYQLNFLYYFRVQITTNYK